MTERVPIHPGQGKLLNSDNSINPEAAPAGYNCETEFTEVEEAEIKTAETDRVYRAWDKASPEELVAARKALEKISSDQELEQTPEPEENDFYLPLSILSEHPDEYLEEYKKLLESDDKILIKRREKIRRAFSVAAHDHYYKVLLSDYIEKLNS